MGCRACEGVARSPAGIKTERPVGTVRVFSGPISG